MADQVEDILRDIHVLFAKSKSFNNSPDLVIVSKEEMFRQFERLNEALGDVLEQYEATTLSRERARIDMEREKANMIASAKKSADDVHAAALLYTDNMIASIDRALEYAKFKVKHDMLESIAQLEDLSEILAGNKESVKTELTQMHDNETYLGMLEELRKKEEKRKMAADNGSEEDQIPDDTPAPAKVDIRISKPGENTGVTFSTRRSHKQGSKKPVGESSQPTKEHEEGTPYSAEEFDLDNEYFAWQEEQENGGEPQDKTKKKHWFSKK